MVLLVKAVEVDISIISTNHYVNFMVSSVMWFYNASKV